MKNDYYDYVINVGSDINALEPLVAVKQEDKAIMEANRLEQHYSFVDVVYSPEIDPEINEIVYKNY